MMTTDTRPFTATNRKLAFAQAFSRTSMPHRDAEDGTGATSSARPARHRHLSWRRSANR